MQNNQRVLLFAALAIVIYLIYTKWVEVNQPIVVPTEQVAQVGENGVSTVPITANSGSNSNSVMAQPSSDEISTLLSLGEIAVAPDSYITVETDVYKIKIARNGGDIFEVGLPTQPISLEEPNVPYLLMSSTDERYLISQTGLIGIPGLENTPNHENSVFSASKDYFKLEDGKDELVVPLIYTNAETGYSVEKRYTFKRDKFHINYEQTLTNNNDTSWKGIQYLQFMYKELVAQRSGIGASSYQGTVYSLPVDNSDSKLSIYEKVKYKNMNSAKSKHEGKGGWISFIEQYFIVAAIPGADKKSAKATFNFIETDKLEGGKYLTRLYDQNLTTINPGESHTFESQLYFGPKIKEQLQETADNLDLTLDYGWFSFISNIMLWLLIFFHKYVGNWGWSIILLTVTAKIALLWFANKGYVSMARMRNVGPKLQLIRENYADDKQKLSEEMMKLYRKEKINPLGGCWPIIIQIPIFISLFWMLMESVELRQAPWIFWIQDLSQRDPYFILPLLMGVTMFFQQRLNPTPPDPTQAMIIKWMPVVFTFMFMWFASGIVLYWVTNNLLTILQQWMIMRKIEKTESSKV